MWKKPWSLKEGFVIGSGLVATGLLLQFSVGSIDWDLFAWPANVILIVVLLVGTTVMHFLRKRVYLFRFLSTMNAAVPALLWAVVLTVIMGLTRQASPEHIISQGSHGMLGDMGITYMLGYWPFVLIYAWMALILSLTVLKRWRKPRWRDIPFYLNHLGLLIVIVCGTLGSADMQRLTMTIGQERPEWRALNKQGQVVELPIAIQLDEFQLNEYPPRVVVANTKSGTVADAAPKVNIIRAIEKAAPVSSEDSTWYVAWPSSGAVTALYVNTGHREGWLSSGSYLFPMQMLSLNDSLSLAMTEREPRAFVSKVHIYTKTQKNILTTIEVNKPFCVDGWKIYQLDYDRQKGRWSDISVLELVNDPWLPVVYLGITMLLLGAVCMFLFTHRKERRANE